MKGIKLAPKKTVKVEVPTVPPAKAQAKNVVQAPAKKSAAPKADKSVDSEKAVTVQPLGEEFIVSERSPDGGIWKDSIEQENPLEGDE